MNRLLLITTIPETINAFLLPFARYFRAKGWQVDALASDISGNVECVQTFDQVWDINWSRNPLAPANLLTAPITSQNVVEQGKYDIVHVHTPVASFVARYALKNLHPRPQIIYTSHGFTFTVNGNPFKNALFTALEKWAGHWTDFLIVMNQEDYEAAQQKCLIAPERIHFMPGIGLDLQYYNPNQVPEGEIARVRQELNLSPEISLCLSVAELIPRKRPFDILRAFAKLGRSQACLAFAGNGSLLTSLQQLAHQLGIEHQVHFLGFRNDIPALMCASVATILASEYEGLPRCVMESMGLETPVIGSKVRGTQDLLSEQTGLLFSLGDVEELTQAIAWILDHPEEAHQMGKRSRIRIASHDLNHILELHEQLYAEALAQKKEVFTHA
jgi:glycosyltransferase involved in cell wall biosynthesis